MAPEWLMYVGLAAVVWLGAIFPFIWKRGPRYFHTVLLFSGAYLLGVALLSLLPAVLVASSDNAPWILAGFFLQLIGERMSGGSEHGHIHAPNGQTIPRQVVVQVLLGLSLHAVMDGASVGGYSAWSQGHAHGDVHGNAFVAGILMHKIGEGFALASLFVLARIRTMVAVGIVAIFSFLAPGAAWFMAYLPFSPSLLTSMMGLVAGSFLHISVSILIENAREKRGQPEFAWQWGIILMGFLLAWLSTYR